MSALEPQLDLDDFRAVMSMWPSGVTITTTIDDDGLRWGFTASAFSSLSLEPPLILVCVRAAAKSVLTDAVASLECVMHATVPGGDHTILIGKVVHADVNATVRDSAPAMVHFARRFGVVGPVERPGISEVFDEWPW